MLSTRLFLDDIHCCLVAYVENVHPFPSYVELLTSLIYYRRWMLLKSSVHWLVRDLAINTAQTNSTATVISERRLKQILHKTTVIMNK